MAMPSMSRPRSGHDMDILKSILGNSSDHSSTGDKSPTKAHSRTNSASSSSSSSSSRKSGSCLKSEHDVDSSCSDSESRTESQRDRSSSVDEKLHPLKETKRLEGKELGSVSVEKQAKNCKNSEMDSMKDSELGSGTVTGKKKKRRINRKRKVHLKTQNNVEPQKSSLDNKELEDIKNNDATRRDDSEESQQQEKYKYNNNSLSNSQSSLGDGHPRKHTKPGEPKTQHKQQPLSKRAQRTLRLYPERYGDPDRLKHNYEELQEILQSQFIEDRHSVNEELVKETKRVLGRYQQGQSGYAGLLRPPPGAPTAGRRVRRIRSATRERSPASTQTDLTADPSRARPQSAKGYYFIDTTKADQSKRVTFVQVEDEDEEEELADDDEDKQKYSTYTVSIQLNKQTNRESSSEPERGRIIKKITRRPKSASSIADKKKPVSRSLSPHVSPSRKTTLRRMSESSTSRSRSSHSRSPSMDRKQTDNHLENTENAKIKEWLKQKNRLLRQQRREERRLRREKRKQEAEEAKQKMAKHEKAEILFRKWVEQKQKETRLLKKRRRKQRQDFNCSVTTISSETETIDLKSGEMVNGGAAKNANESLQTECKDGKCVLDGNDKKITLNIVGQQGLRCTCGFMAGVQSAKTETKLPQHAKKPKKRAPMLKKSESEAASMKNKASDDENSEEKKRLSYNEWLKQKRSADMERRKQEKKEQEELLAQSDPEMDSIVNGMAKRRIKNILQGKKPVNSGISSIDDKANKSMDEKMLRRQRLNGRAEEVTPPSGSSARYYRWVPKDDNKTDRGAEKRPLSAQVRSSQKKAVPKRQRPASATTNSASLPPSQPEEPSEGSVSEACAANTENRRSISPKPKVPLTKAYTDVKYQRQSWDEFSDYVWEKVNEEAGVKCDYTTETPQQEESKIKPESKVMEKPKNQSIFDISGESTQSSSRKVDKEEEKNRGTNKSEVESVQNEDEQLEKEDGNSRDQSAAEQEADAKDQLPEVDRNLEDKSQSSNLSSSTDTAGETDKATSDEENGGDHYADDDDDKQAVEKQCISEVVEETIFSMTEVDGKSGSEHLEADFASNIRRPSVALENIPEEIEEEVEQSKEEDSQSSEAGEQSTEESGSDAGEKAKEEPMVDNQVEEAVKERWEVDAAEHLREDVETTDNVNKDTSQEDVKDDINHEDNSRNGTDKNDYV